MSLCFVNLSDFMGLVAKKVQVVWVKIRVAQKDIGSGPKPATINL